MNHLNVERPNIILIILDSARRDMFGSYGNSEGLTPNIDQLAKKSLILRDHYAAACGSAPAHTSIFTGHHAGRHMMLHNLCEMKEDLKAFPVLLRQLGYKCYGHCKASFIPPAGYEELFGFDEFRYPGSGKSSTRNSARRELADRLRQFPVLYHFFKRLYEKIQGDEGQIGASAAIHDGQDSLDYLFQKLEEGRKESCPIFAYTTLLHPHLPYYPPKPYREKLFNGSSPHPKSYEILRNLHAYMNGDFGPAEEAIRSVRKLYQADLLYADHLVGEFVRKLENSGLLKNSILILTSDHGELLGEHGAINHGATVWEELFSTPCLIYFPEKIEGGKSIDQLTSSLDIVPTIFDLLGESQAIKEETALDGISVLSEDLGKNNRYLVVDSPPTVLPERLKEFPNLLFELNVIRRVVRTSDYKYIWQSDGSHHLYRVGNSETKENNLYDSLPNLVANLHEKMIDFYESIDSNFKIDQYPVPLSRKVGAKMTDPTIRKELRRLGYM